MLILLNLVKNLIKSKKGELHPILGIILGLFLLYLSIFTLKFLKVASTDPDGAVDMLLDGINRIPDIF
ncbi:hypothetical protein HNP92_001231 [Methanococcus maripaludis]|uniref:Uncharacterized protein n=1 Tax=Methanococcus maripaludis TaxID=39152 RepID=A0A7J9S7C5_METMI|nr:hypothetical protein [Methanococcus maripaludis]MBB6401926.1 hypothetical protein [Methanococcus maripaludis]